MTLLEAIILGIIQGLSEFLPISSSGHLKLFQNIFEIKEPTMTFDILLHVATLIPILIVYRKTVWKLIKQPFQKLTYLLVAATIPAVVVALLFGDYLEAIGNSTKFLAVGFTITGLALLYADKTFNNTKKLKDITYADALLIGCAQAVAIAPSISRSGSTISASLWRKFDRETGAQFSFLMSIPAIIGALVLEIAKILMGQTMIETMNPVYMIAGFLAAALSGYLAIQFMLEIIKKAQLKYFAYYVFGLAAFIAVDTFFLHGVIFS